MVNVFMCGIIIIKRISWVPIYHTRWQHRALYNNTNHTHMHAHTHTHTHSVGRGDGQGCEKQFSNIKQVRLEGGFERGGRIIVAECLRQIFPDRWASIRKRSFAKCFCLYTGGWQRFVCQMQIIIVLLVYHVFSCQCKFYIICKGQTRTR